MKRPIWLPPTTTCPAQANLGTPRPPPPAEFGYHHHHRAHHAHPSAPTASVRLPSSRTAIELLLRIEGTEGHRHEHTDFAREPEREERREQSTLCHFTEMTSIEHQALVRAAPAPGQSVPACLPKTPAMPAALLHHARVFPRAAFVRGDLLFLCAATCFFCVRDFLCGDDVQRYC